MQKRSSKNTSVNTHHLPAIYHKVNWRHYACAADDYHVFDIGCGQLATQYMAYDKLKQFGIQKFYPWDPNHRCIISKTKTVIEMSKTNTNKVILCANVLNVIDDDSALNSLIALICDISVIQEPSGIYHMNPVFVSVYEGDRSGVGRQTKQDCWQRNERLCIYLEKFNDYIKKKYNHNSNFFKIKYGMIIGTIQYGGHISYET